MYELLILLAAGLVAFIIFQHREQQRLFQQTIDLTWELQNGLGLVALFAGVALGRMPRTACGFCG